MYDRKRATGRYTYQGLQRAMARHQAADEVLPQFRELRNQVIEAMPKWAKYSGTPTWAQMSAGLGKLHEVRKMAGLPSDERGLPDAVAYMLFDHPLAVTTKQEIEGLLGWMMFQAEDGSWHLTVRARDGLLRVAKDPVFDALRSKIDQCLRRYDGLGHDGPGVGPSLDYMEDASKVARLLGREFGTELYRMVRGK